MKEEIELIISLIVLGIILGLGYIIIYFGERLNKLEMGEKTK